MHDYCAAKRNLALSFNTQAGTFYSGRRIAATFRHAIARSQTATMHNRARVVRGSCKILSRNIHYKHARMPIDFQRTDNVKRAASYNIAALQNATSP